MINTTISVSRNLRCSVEEMTPVEVHPGWVWNDAARENFQRNLSSAYYQEKFESLCNDNNLTPIALAKEIKLLLLENTKTSCLREKKTFKDEDKKSQPWFDSECKLNKNEINRLGKAVCKSPLNPVVRANLNNAKKGFKQTILAKKRK